MNETAKTGDNWLSWTFNVVAITIAANIFWQILLDPLFFPVFHGPQNVMAQAAIMFMHDWFGWIPYHLGFTGQGGLFQPILEWILSDQLATVAAPTASNFAQPAQSFSMDGL